MIYFSFLPLALHVTYLFSIDVLSEYKRRIDSGYPYHPTDIKWNTYILIKYPIYAFVGGVLAGVLGIGGGLILGPMLLEMGINPIISTSTSNFLVLFTSSSTTLQFVIMGMMNFDYGLICTVCSTVGSMIGTLAIQNLIRKTGRPSILIFCLAVVLAVSTVLIPWDTTNKIIQKVNSGMDIWGMNSAC